MGCGWMALYLSCFQTESFRTFRAESLEDERTESLRALGPKAFSTNGLQLGRKYLKTLGLDWNHIDVGDGCLVYVPLSTRPIWGAERYSSRFPNLHTTLWVPALRRWDIANLPSRWDRGVYARRLVTGHDCFGVACRALRLAGHDVSRWRGPSALFEYLNGLEGVRVEQATR